jgi:NAD(P)-dependent dehydrogenase (short-subunit alcohol dehydrogenase family)
MSDLATLDGRVIAIAGASGGLGPTVARRLGEAGAIIAGVDRSQEHLDALRAELELPDERFDGRVADLLDEEAARDWAAHLRERFGRVDALLHLVGGWRGGQPLAEAPLSDYEWLHDLLVRTVQHTTRAFWDALVASEHGRFILVSSSQAQRPEGTNASYAAAKAAAETWTLALADSFQDSSATANVIVVNAILTPQMREQSSEKEFRTFTSVEEIAEAIRFVCSDAAAKMNGKRLSLHP